MSNGTEMRKIRRNALIGACIVTLIATLHLLKGHTGSCVFLYSLAGFLFIVGGFFPKAFKKITGTAGDFIVSVLLSVIFFAVITPIGIIMRLFGKDTLDKKIDTSKDSYWIDRPPEDSGAGLDKQY
jgi:hypothetical protein